jgi:hypothetical protein
MPFKLKLIFTGLCTFVEHTSGTRAKVLLVDGRNVDTNPPFDPPLIHCCPVIRFNRADLDPASLRQADLCRDGVPLSCHDGLCFLDREDLRIEAATGSVGMPPLAITKGVRPGTAPEPTQFTRADWSWVADLQSIQAGAGTPQPGWFTTPPAVTAGLSRPPIVARFELDRGTLSTLEFFRSPENTHFPSIFSFPQGNPNPTYKQALASFVQCEFTCDDNTQMQISTAPWDVPPNTPGNPGHPLVFRPMTKDLTIEVSNAPFFDVMQEFFPVGNGWSFPPTFTSGHSFLHFYQLQQPFAAGDFPGTTNRTKSSSTLASALSFDKGVGCSPSKTGMFTFP